MEFFEQLLDYLKKPEEETKGRAPDGVCSVCWGYQEYDHKIRKLFNDDQIDVLNHLKKYTYARKFVKEHIDGIRLREGEIQICPVCGEKHNKNINKNTMKRTANAVWNGSLKEGEGKLTTQSNVLNNSKYCFNSRFGEGKSTNPDELLAAAHAGCFAMALSLILGKAGFTPDSLEVTSTVSMDVDKLELTGSHLTLNAKIPNISKEKFMECANAAKEGCPVSKALSFKITLDATLG